MMDKSKTKFSLSTVYSAKSSAATGGWTRSLFLVPAEAWFFKTCTHAFGGFCGNFLRLRPVVRNLDPFTTSFSFLVSGALILDWNTGQKLVKGWFIFFAKPQWMDRWQLRFQRWVCVPIRFGNRWFLGCCDWPWRICLYNRLDFQRNSRRTFAHEVVAKRWSG